MCGTWLGEEKKAARNSSRSLRPSERADEERRQEAACRRVSGKVWLVSFWAQTKREDQRAIERTFSVGLSQRACCSEKEKERRYRGCKSAAKGVGMGTILFHSQHHKSHHGLEVGVGMSAGIVTAYDGPKHG